MTDYCNVRLNRDTHRQLQEAARAAGRPLGAHVAVLLGEGGSDPGAGAGLADRLDRLELALERVHASLQVLQVAVVAGGPGRRAAAPPARERAPGGQTPERASVAAGAPATGDAGAERQERAPKHPAARGAVAEAARAASLPTTGAELLGWRRELGLTPKQLADLLGCTRQGVTYQEKASGRGGDLDSPIGAGFLAKLLSARERGDL